MTSRLPLFILLSLSFLSASIGQQVFPTEIGIWQTEEALFIGPQDFFYEICGDTSINNQEYDSIFRFQLGSNGEKTNYTFLGGTRLEGSKVYFYPEINPEERLLYDFSLEENDNISLINFNNITVEMQVDSIRSTTINNEDRKVIYFTPLMPDTIPEFWIEGVGSSRGPFTRAYTETADFVPFLTCFNNGTSEYSVPDTNLDCEIGNIEFCEITDIANDPRNELADVRVFPNPFERALNVEVATIKEYQLTIRDNQGRIWYSNELSNSNRSILLDQIPPGLYYYSIQDTDSGEILKSGKIVAR